MGDESCETAETAMFSFPKADGAANDIAATSTEHTKGLRFIVWKMCICYGVMLPESGRLCKLLVRNSAKKEPKAEDLLEVEPLVCRVRVMRCKVVFCALFTVRPES